jgi:hypothetical protein
MKNGSKKFLATGLFGVTLLVGGCAARTGPIRGEANVEGDSNSARGRGQVNTTSEEGNRKQSTSGTVSGSASGSGTGTVSGSASGSGSVTASE